MLSRTVHLCLSLCAAKNGNGIAVISRYHLQSSRLYLIMGAMSCSCIIRLTLLTSKDVLYSGTGTLEMHSEGGLISGHSCGCEYLQMHWRSSFTPDAWSCCCTAWAAGQSEESTNSAFRTPSLLAAAASLPTKQSCTKVMH